MRTKQDRNIYFFALLLFIFLLVLLGKLERTFGTPILVIAVVLFLFSVLALHRQFFKLLHIKQLELEKKYADSLTEALKEQRHAWRNHLQIISGYVETDQGDKAIHYVEKLNLSLSQGLQSMQVGVPEWEIILYHFIHRFHQIDIALTVENHLNVNFDFEAYPTEDIARLINDICQGLYQHCAFSEDGLVKKKMNQFFKITFLGLPDDLRIQVDFHGHEHLEMLEYIQKITEESRACLAASICTDASYHPYTDTTHIAFDIPQKRSAC